MVDDPFGKVLGLSTDEMSVELEGGQYGKFMFASPDCLTSYSYKGEDYLVLNEDIMAPSRGRSEQNFALNDVFRYNLRTKELKQILRSPKGSETTGGIFDAYGNYFLNIQHPDGGNKAPFDRSTLIIIKGLVG